MGWIYTPLKRGFIKKKKKEENVPKSHETYNKNI